MSEERGKRQALQECLRTFAQFVKLVEHLRVTDNESLSLAEDVKESFETFAKNLEATINRLTKQLEAIHNNYLEALDYVVQLWKEIERSLEQELLKYSGMGDDFVGQSLNEALPRLRDKPETDLKKRLENLEKLPERMKHDYVMAFAKAAIRGLSSLPDSFEPIRSRLQVNIEETKEARRDLREAKRYLQKATAQLPDVYEQVLGKQTDQIMKGLDNFLDSFAVPAHRHENELLNQIIEITVDFFLEHDYSKNRAYQEVGELLVSEGLMEESEHIVDNVRHRYSRRKKRHREVTQST